MTSATSPPLRPSIALLAVEGARAAGELAWFASFQLPLDSAPRGDGHSVLVLPGLGASDRSTIPLRSYLRRLGYDTHGWRLGVNRPSADLIDGLQHRFNDLSKRAAGPMSIIGWSLGGIYARELARVRPSAIRQVITLGSPFRHVPGEESYPASALRALGPDRPQRLPYQGDLAMPSTAIYSRSDGIVPWRSSRGSSSINSESIEVVGSHCGLGHHPGALWAIADRLAQRADTWRPFEPSRTWATLYPLLKVSAKNPK